MSTKGRILVVDDEEIVGSSCIRILKPDGHEVIHQSSAHQAFSLLEKEIFDLILLDIKMKEMNGVVFLKKLRKTSPHLPVIIITGHSTEEHFYATSQLGIFDYVKKPFSPTELLSVVKECLDKNHNENSADNSLWPDSRKEFYFFDESWFQQNFDGQVRTGAIIPHIDRSDILNLKLPHVGQHVHRGLPLASIESKNGQRIIHSPVSGVITSVNHNLNRDSAPLLWDDPCGEGWIAHALPDNIENDIKESKIRKIILAVSDEKRLQEKRDQLTRLGLKVFVLKDIKILNNVISLMPFEDSVLFLDTLSYGAEGPQMLRTLNEEHPNIKVIVLADADSTFEEKYRAEKIFYYAMKPFADKEILDILFNAFVSRPPRNAVTSPLHNKKDSSLLPQWISKMTITNHEGKKTSLLVNGEVLMYHAGLGKMLIGKFLDNLYSLETNRGVEEFDFQSIEGRAKISREEDSCDSLLLLRCEGSDQIQGTLKVEEGEKFFHIAQDSTGTKSTILTIHTAQKNSQKDNLLDFDPRIIEGLAEKIFKLMTVGSGKTRYQSEATTSGCKECKDFSSFSEVEKIKLLFKRLDEFLADYVNKPGGLIPALQTAQGLFGHLPKHVIKYIAGKFNKSYSEVAGVVSFYSFFSTTPRGKNLIRVCLGTACYVRGGKQLVDDFKKHLNIEIGETTEDKMFTLEIARCFGACGLAPVITVNDTVHQRVKSSQIANILKEYSNANLNSNSESNKEVLSNEMGI
ncbi:MAG: NAD(P)H-dependent oxidoreductase subunit E [Oligoflexia bacterium]|nr:NAD(P)H-dependent oxidoreductase subunit E [Oligoflexia bacterium]